VLNARGERVFWSICSRSLNSVPHVTAAIEQWIERVAMIPVNGSPDPPDVCVIELGILVFYPLSQEALAHASKAELWETSRAPHLSTL
jgi:hypothetical protein